MYVLYAPVRACVYSFQSRPLIIYVLSVLPLTCAGLCCGFLLEFMGYQVYVNFHNKSIPYLKYTVGNLRENSG